MIHSLDHSLLGQRLLELKLCIVGLVGVTGDSYNEATLKSVWQVKSFHSEAASK